MRGSLACVEGVVAEDAAEDVDDAVRERGSEDVAGVAADRVLNRAVEIVLLGHAREPVGVRIGAVVAQPVEGDRDRRRAVGVGDRVDAGLRR